MASRDKVLKVLRTISSVNCTCPAHSSSPFRTSWKDGPNISRRFADEATMSMNSTDYAFEMKCSNLRYGLGVTKEVGMDLKAMNVGRVCLVTDQNLVHLPPVKAVLDSLHRNGIQYDVFDQVRVEPTDLSFQAAIQFAKSSNFDAFLAVGGGSVMDTCKAANLYASDPTAEFLDYVNVPLGKGKPITCKLKPLIAVPTTAGTGSETTGVAIFDYIAMETKTGIANRALCPTLGIVDPLHLQYLPERVTAFSGFDVLCHALESYTAIPYQLRSPCPATPLDRPAYQGSNPISDIWALNTLRMIRKYFKRAVNNRDDLKALSKMHLASSFAGMGFGNAGVHLCHGMSYPISGQVKNYSVPDYKTSYPIIPHGLSVVITSPAVFNFTAPACPERHLTAAEALGCSIINAHKEDAGAILADTVRGFMSDLKIENGLKALGFNGEDIPQLVKKTLPQERVTKLSPRAHTQDSLAKILEESMTIY